MTTSQRRAVLFDDNAEDFFLAGAENKFAWLTQIDLFPCVVYDDTINLNRFLLYEPFGLTARGREIENEDQGREFCQPAACQFLYRQVIGTLAIAESGL